MRGLTLFFALGASVALFGCQSSDRASEIRAGADIEVGIAPRYLGYAKTPAPAARIPVVLDLAPTPGKPGTFYGFLKFMAGDFGGHEYTTFYFKDVRVDAATGSVTFDGGEGDVHVTLGTVVGTSFKAQVEIVKEGVTLPIELSSNDDRGTFADLKVLGPVTGQYVGQCEGKKATLQLEASRWRGFRAADGTSFGGYRVFGRRGQFDEVVCGDKDRACVAETFSNVGVQFFGRTIKLGAKDDTPCDVGGSMVRCGQTCTFSRNNEPGHAVLGEVRGETYRREYHVQDDGAPPPPSRTGQYYGYVHHEGQDTYQLLALNVRAAPEVDLVTGASRQGEYVAAVATLYFGEGDSSEFVAYRFREAVAPANDGPLVFDGDGEALLVVDDWRGKVIRGTWYGKTFGRVGTVELTRDLVPLLEPSARTMQHVSGRYVGEGWEYEMAVSANLSEQTSDFYPLKMFGWARERLESSRRRTIEDGAFDFYTGAIAFRLDDGRTVLGRVQPNGMDLYWAPPPRLGSLITGEDHRTFQRVGDVSSAQAKLAPP